MNDLVYKITEEVIETEENFIFTTIKPWCESVLQRTIPKRDLERALVLYFNGDSILDKIRAEIAEEQNDCMVKEQIDTAYGLELALMIIDKYNGESEDAE